MRLSDPQALRAGGTACVRWCAPWFRWAGCEQVAHSQHGRDGRSPFFCAAKSNFKETLVSLLRSCLRQSISLWSLVVNSAGFGFKTM